jgi:hypothetical protein
VTETVFIVEALLAGSVHWSAIVYTLPLLSFPVRSARRFTLSGPVICQSDEVAPSVPLT